MTLTMDRARLRQLPRVRLQALAKRESVRAVGKNDDIIRRLVQKYPKGVPVQEDGDNLSASSAPPPKIVLKISPKGTPSVSVIPRSSGARTDSKGKGKAAPEESLPSPSSSTEALELLYLDSDDVAGPSNRDPQSAPAPRPEVAASEARPDQYASPSGESLPAPPSERSSSHVRYASQDTNSRAAHRRPNPGRRADNEPDEDDRADRAYIGLDYPKGAPTHYMVVDALRTFTPLSNDIPSMEARVIESRSLLERTESTLERALPDARELTVTREYVETFVLGKMKDKPELFDGTAKMDKADRKLRMEWLRAERKTENEKKWRETNVLYEKKGLQPLPFVAFASESDEEDIESLQTTPASSKNGGSKRPREASVDGESRDANGDSDTDGESRRRKRARS